MNYQEIGDKVRHLYNQQYSSRYRKSDELQIQSEVHKHYCQILKNICCSFGHCITALDVGCGTGRYFHCLQNVERLVGIDISPYMLEEARDPVSKEEIEVNRVELVSGNIFETDFEDQSFDFIYSIGVLEEHSPFDLQICDKLHRLLKPNGRLFFTVSDISSHKAWKMKRRVAEIVHPILSIFPSTLETKFRRYKSFYLTLAELEEVMMSSSFMEYEISRYVTITSRYKGAHYECTAIRE